jgi:hypothetical protein
MFAERAREFVSWGAVKLPAGQAAAVQKNIDEWRVRTSGKTLSSFLAYVRRGGAGISGVNAARIAMHIFGPDDMKRIAGTRASFVSAMRNAGVNASVVKSWANKLWPPIQGPPAPAGTSGSSGGSIPPRPTI